MKMYMWKTTLPIFLVGLLPRCGLLVRRANVWRSHYATTARHNRSRESDLHGCREVLGRAMTWHPSISLGLPRPPYPWPPAPGSSHQDFEAYRYYMERAQTRERNEKLRRWAALALIVLSVGVAFGMGILAVRL